MIVADTNLIAYLLLPGPHAESASAVYTRDANWVAPPLWRSEFRSVLAQHVLHASLASDDAAFAWETALQLVEEHEAPDAETLGLALTGSVSAYDAEFVALAHHLGCPLVTSDRRILNAAPDVAVSMDGFSV